MFEKISLAGVDKMEWLRLRKSGIGGSDAGAVCGVNPYSSAMKVFQDKTGEESEEPDSEAIRIGHDLEDYVAQRFMEATGLKVRKSNFMYRSVEHPFMIADVDRLVVGEDAGLECKTASAYNADKWADGNIPLHYVMQCYHYMAVTGKRKWYIAAVVLGRRFNDLMVFLNADSRLIPKNYEKKILESQYYVSFHNGILDVRTLRLYKHSEEYLVFYELDAYWDEEAYPSKFLGFVKQASGNDESVMKRMVESIGYLLSSVNDGKYFFVMGTERDSGKSTLGKLLEIIVGHSYIAHLSTYQMGNRFAFGDIHGKTLNLSMDLPKGKLTPVVVSIIKQITGGDAITTDQKYERMREAHSNMRFLFATNHPVIIPKEEDDAFWNRMVIIPFQYSVEKSEMDHELLQKLLDEKDEIISLCLTALHKMLKGGCIFSECQAAEEMKRQWRKYEGDLDYTLNSFLDECVKVTGSQKDSLYAQDFFEAYQGYCQNHNWNHMDYNKVIHWCESNLPGCERKRIHRTGENPRSGLVGIRLVDGKQ